MPFKPEELLQWEADDLARREGLRAAGATSAEIEEIARKANLGIDAAVELSSHRREKAEKEAERVARWRRHDREEYIQAGVPEFHLRHVFDVEPDSSPALDAALQFVADDSLFLLLLGGVGTRKTGAAVAALTKVPKEPKFSRTRADYLFVTADKLAGLGGFDKADELAKLERCYLLVVDDVGVEFGDAKGWFSSLFGALMNKRYSNALKTLVTSNLTKDQFKANYGERVADRIREAGTIFTIAGKSMRARRLPKNWIEPMPAQTESMSVDMDAEMGIKPDKGARS